MPLTVNTQHAPIVLNRKVPQCFHFIGRVNAIVMSSILKLKWRIEIGMARADRSEIKMTDMNVYMWGSESLAIAHSWRDGNGPWQMQSETLRLGSPFDLSHDKHDDWIVDILSWLCFDFKVGPCVPLPPKRRAIAYRSEIGYENKSSEGESWTDRDIEIRKEVINFLEIFDCLKGSIVSPLGWVI